MGFKESLKKFGSSRAIEVIRDILSSKFFPFITAAVVLICYYLAWDLVTIWYISICTIAVLLLLKDVTPIISLFLFMNIMISWQNSPSDVAGNSDFFFRPYVLVQVGIAVGLLVVAIVGRIVWAIKNKRFKLTPTFWGLCMFAVAMLLNCAFSAEYTAMTTLYGAFMAFFFLVIFMLGNGNITVEKSTFEKIAWAFFALSICLVIELVVAYLTYDGLFGENGIDRLKLMFGWGIYNTMGMLFIISYPSIAYLALKYKHGWTFTAYLTVLLACTYLTMSRQSMMFGTIAYAACIVLILIRSKKRLPHVLILAAAVAVAAVVVVIKWEFVLDVIRKVTDNFFYGSGRIDVWKQGLKRFVENPVFGAGFFVAIEEDPGYAGIAIIPDMFHNTIVQLLAAGGVVALLAYLIHRANTVVSYLKNPSYERTYIALTILSLVMLNLLDNYLFYMLPTLVYSMLVAVLINSEGVKIAENNQSE